MLRSLKQKRTIEESKFVGAINKNFIVDECLLCGRKMSSPCNSHVVPRFILEEIAEEGHVSYGYAFQKYEVGGLDRVTGINNAYPFKLICKKCDAKYFKHYENPNNLLNFDSLSEKERKIILCEMAIKTHLSHINMKFKTIVMNNMTSQGKVEKLLKNHAIVFAEQIDINEHQAYIKKLKGVMKSNKNPFVVLFEKTLNYKTKIASQTIINYNFDLNGNQIYDPFLIESDNKCSYFYLMILPFKGITRVIFYIEKEYQNNVLPIIEEFNSLSEDEKLHFLFISLIIYDQQFYMSPSFAKTIAQKDKKLIKLYSNTEKYFKWQRKLTDFRKYKNYLLKEYKI